MYLEAPSVNQLVEGDTEMRAHPDMIASVLRGSLPTEPCKPVMAHSLSLMWFSDIGLPWASPFTFGFSAPFLLLGMQAGPSSSKI